MDNKFISTVAKKLNVISLFVLASIFSMFSAAAKDPIYIDSMNDAAISGYDTVAYFTKGEAIKGSKEFVSEWNGATWHFSSAEHQAKFESSPENFAPQYGGYCAYAMSFGQTAKVDPNAWKIVDGKLYLNFNKQIQQDWNKDVAGYISKADKNWPAALN